MGDRIEGEVGDSARNVVIGRNNTQHNIQYADTGTWREFVRRDLQALGAKFVILLIAVILLYVLGAVVTGLVIREIDLIYGRIDRLEERLEPPPYYYPGLPLP